MFISHPPVGDIVFFQWLPLEVCVWGGGRCCWHLVREAAQSYLQGTQWSLTAKDPWAHIRHTDELEKLFFSARK